MGDPRRRELSPPSDELPTRPIDLRKLADLVEDGFEEVTAEIAVESFLQTRRQGVPRVAIPTAELLDQLLSHREAFVVSLIDGVSSVEMLLDIAGMPEAEAVSVLCNLHARGVVKFD